jgi:anti-sigma regulatory factor (Ser/Thr protein kinase)
MVRSPERHDRGETLAEPTLELKLERDLQAPAIARAATSGHCEDFELSGSICHTLILLVSEVVANAVLHSNGPANAPVLLSIRLENDVVHVTVTDAGTGFVPQPRKPESTQGGYGLYLLEKAASRWGVDRIGGTRVWFELPRTV